MNEPVELFCTQDDDGKWIVWFPYPLGGMDVLETFDNEDDAKAFLEDQMNGADYS